MRIDPYNGQRVYQRWKHGAAANGIAGLTGENAALITRFVEEMETGRNVSRGARKGPRGYLRLNTLRTRLTFVARALAERQGVKLLTEVTEDEVHAVFSAMRNGSLCKQNGKPYRSTGDYVKVFKTFWHWHMTVQRKRGVAVPDICLDLDDRTEKPPWVYLTEEDLRALCRHAKFSYQVLMLFLFDSGIRAPTELMNVRVRDLTKDCTQLRIGASKTFNRTINLLICGPTLATWIREQRLGDDDPVFRITPGMTNRYLKRLAKRVLGEQRSPGGSTYSELTMYDFRHSSACYWLPRYKSETAFKYRFGWRRSEMIDYYTAFLGMRDTITEDDLLLDDTKAAIEKELERAVKANALLREQLASMETRLTKTVE